MGASSARPRNFCILVVDDDPDTLDSFRQLLEGGLDHVRVLTASSGPDALEIVKNESVDLILADYVMPGMDGVEFLRQAREGAPGVPRILVTAFPDMNVALEAINRGRVSGFLLKPIEAKTLLELVRGSLSDVSALGARARRLAREIDLLRRSPVGPPS